MESLGSVFEANQRQTGEMSQAERDRLEEDRLARARAEREAQLSGRSAGDVRNDNYLFPVRCLIPRATNSLKLSATVWKRIVLPVPVRSVRLNSKVSLLDLYELNHKRPTCFSCL